jgi:hypothetical protein
MKIMTILLKDYQSKHYPFVKGDKTYQVFPFAWYDLEKDDIIKNLDTGEVYRVESLVAGHDEWERNAVKLKCKNPPKDYHVLRLDEKKNKYVRFISSFPDSEAKPYEFTSSGNLQVNEDQDIPSWIDTITYNPTNRAPGSRSDGMFSGNNVEYRPLYRTEDKDGNEIYGRWEDNRIRLDFWTRDNTDSELLREWFADFILKYSWVIEANGLDHFMWTGDGTATTATRWRTDIVHRSAVYEFRTESSNFKEMFKIRTITTSAIIPKEPGDVGMQGETIKITS